MNNIEKLYREWRSLQPIDKALQRRMDQSFMIDFNYNSNHMEGNTLTYGQTKLLLLFGKVKGDALMRDYEEMKAHNAGLEMIKVQALDKERPLSESFLRDLNRIILAGDFYKLSNNGEYRYKIHTGVYKTRPNSVITFSGEMFDYASPEETPALMNDLIRWYNAEEPKEELSPVELAALFHYRYIRIHPFEDGNGRIARLMMNYILYRHGYPMVVIPTADRKKYLDTLGKCDEATGKMPFSGAHATLEQIKPFTDLISLYVERKLKYALQLAKGEVSEISETGIEQQKDPVESENVSVNVSVTVSVKENILHIIGQFPTVTVKELAKMLVVSERTIYRNLNDLRNAGKIERVGSDKSGYWKINH
ncbi:MAG: Fic family protein [Prevotellaceae bacterium]|jgi:Fic family protein|nr:Fic family protein [Prevotellaceae bacterium]